MKCWILQPHESWIVDEMAKQFKRDNSEICTEKIEEADVVWAMADWCFEKIPSSHIKERKPIVQMLHHFVPEKFDQRAALMFVYRDQFTTAYTVPNEHTLQFIIEKGLTKKPVHVVPYWVDSQSWRKTADKLELRKKYGLPDNEFLVGSFQRDTEGHDLTSPKMEKGPDLFCDFVEMEHAAFVPFVVLAGWRRQYVISRLEKAGVAYKYFELPNQETLNELYQTLDLYPVCSRYEGGPQAFGEAGILGIPVISRPVGMATSVLPESAIDPDVWKAVPAVPNVEHIRTPGGYVKHIEILKSAIK